ncbi:MAG TPA: hypothetical protein ENJ37_05110 [Deltaproteobacteria bacterium]|nr:hypothetical protein [Deltaproteobacteria bacterium]
MMGWVPAGGRRLTQVLMALLAAGGLFVSSCTTADVGDEGEGGRLAAGSAAEMERRERRALGLDDGRRVADEGEADRGGAGGRKSRTAAPRRPAPPFRGVETSGEYRGHRWFIDKDHMLWWDGRPYVPFGVNLFARTRREVDIAMELGLREFAIWIGDFPAAGYERRAAAMLRTVDDLTSYITERGGTYVVILEQVFTSDYTGSRGDEMTFVTMSELTGRPRYFRKKAFGGGPIPPLHKENIRRMTFDYFRMFGKAVAKDGLRGLCYLNELSTNIGLGGECLESSARAGEMKDEGYPDLRDEPVLLEAYRRWLAGRFGSVGELNARLGTDYGGFDEVEWVTPADITYSRHPCRSLRVRDDIQNRFWVDFWAGQYVSYARKARELIGDVPFFSKALDYEFHRYSLEEAIVTAGTDGIGHDIYRVVNTTEIAEREELGLPASLDLDFEAMLAAAQNASGRTKLFWVPEHGSGDAERMLVFGSRRELEEFLLDMVERGAKGFFTYQPVDPATVRGGELKELVARSLRWHAELRGSVIGEATRRSEKAGAAGREK